MNTGAHNHESGNFDIAAAFKEGLAQARKEEAALNIMLAGRPGVGKSTLVNAIFGRTIAPVGTGAPVTKEITAYRIPNLPVTVYDTPGFELGKSATEVANYFSAEVKKRVTAEGSEVHFALYCSLAAGSRVEDFEADLVRALASQVETAFVLTQCLDKEAKEVKDLQAYINTLRLPIVGRRTFPVMAEKKQITLVGHTIGVDPFGLDELTRALTGVLHQARRRTFISRQRVNLELKVEAAKDIVTETVVEAAAIAAIPIPVYDIAPLSALQVAMLARITRVMGFAVEPKSVAAACTAVVGAGTAARSASSFLKVFFPIIGSVVNAAVAGSTTYAMGSAYIKACETLLQRQIAGAEIDQSDIVGELVKEWKQAH
ncbi:GTPase [Streptomyces avermitilis]|uniref:GTPase n=1 Tax=Streptomyces avermitilis TaxID=33903 RepID=UPI0033ACE9A6